MQEEETKERPARRPRSRDARPNYYADSDGNRKNQLDRAAEVKGIDDEIAFMRLQIKSLQENEPENLKLILAAVNTLCRLITVRNASKDDSSVLKDAVGKVLKNVAIPLGIKVISDNIT